MQIKREKEGLVVYNISTWKPKDSKNEILTIEMIDDYWKRIKVYKAIKEWEVINLAELKKQLLKKVVKYTKLEIIEPIKQDT